MKLEIVVTNGVADELVRRLCQYVIGLPKFLTNNVLEPEMGNTMNCEKNLFIFQVSAVYGYE